MVLSIKNYVLFVIWKNKKVVNIDLDFWENLVNKDIEEEEECLTQH